MSTPRHMEGVPAGQEFMVVCAVEGCYKRPHARGWCGTHYQRWRNHGDPLEPGQIRGDDEARFLSKVDRTARPSGCWLWRGVLCDQGYGRFPLGGRFIGAHRAAYILFVGPIPEGLQIDHVKARGCEHRNCVNPAHLEPVTLRENVMRSTNFTAENAKKTECPAGHPYDAANTYVAPSGGARQCRKCRTEHAMRTRERLGERIRAGDPTVRHGLRSTYIAGCRCRPCTDVAVAYAASRRRLQAEASVA